MSKQLPPWSMKPTNREDYMPKPASTNRITKEMHYDALARLSDVVQQRSDLVTALQVIAIDLQRIGKEHDWPDLLIMAEAARQSIAKVTK